MLDGAVMKQKDQTTKQPHQQVAADLTHTHSQAQLLMAQLNHLITNCATL
jgi:hypothetical protein